MRLRCGFWFFWMIGRALFREWFAAFDAKAWDRQIEADAEAGKLGAVAEGALNEYRAGKTRPL